MSAISREGNRVGGIEQSHKGAKVGGVKLPGLM